MVGRGKRGEGNLIVTRVLKASHDSRDNLVGSALAHGTIRDARLAETTSTGTAAQHFNRKTIMDELRIWHYGLWNRISRAKVGNDALVYNGRNILPLLRHHISMLRTGTFMTLIIECRHVGARHEGKSTKDFDTRGSSIS